MVRSIAQQDDLLGGDAVLGAVAFSAHHLLLVDDWSDAIEDVLFRLGVAAGVSRSYLIRVGPSENGDHLATQIAEWCAPGVNSQFENPTLQGASLVASGFSRWIALLTDRETVHGVVRQLPDSERRELQRQEIVSIAVFPVFVDGAWWGFIVFDDCEREREWTEHELDSLRVVAGMLGAAEQRRRSEEGRLEAEARYRAMVERIPAVTYTDLVVNGDTVMGFVSPQMEDILGHPPDRFLEDPGFWYELIHPDDLAYLRSLDAFSNTDLRPFDHEYRMRHAHGHWVWVHDISAAVLDESGDLDYFLGFLTDVSSRRHAEERLREAELTFRTMVEHNPAVLYVQEPDPDDATRFVTTYVGPGDEELTGYPRQASVADHGLWHRLLHPEDRERFLAAEAS